MPAPIWYDYAIVRVVPRPEREEFINVGVILSSVKARILEARIELDEARLRTLDPTADIEQIRAHLAAIPLICAGGAAAGALGKLSQRERFHWLTAPRSAVIQTSSVHGGSCEDPLHALEHLVQRMVRRSVAAQAG
ncbi:MAG: DUF3037 domain-containing protein [Xanthomonadales bacterium]|nr:DUF3037 domain-containing protein [Xanthomonadales bacterium]